MRGAERSPPSTSSSTTAECAIPHTSAGRCSAKTVSAKELRSLKIATLMLTATPLAIVSDQTNGLGCTSVLRCVPLMNSAWRHTSVCPHSTVPTPQTQMLSWLSPYESAYPSILKTLAQNLAGRFCQVAIGRTQHLRTTSTMVNIAWVGLLSRSQKILPSVLKFTR